ncbi:hypothetical protein KL905_001016 [Ogataea polymorpha]|nr:hypothetical protein KL935_001707 [Ogataea polymorpha]KAG7910265.1 hypothetical protein KL907_001156 [Ogataea polymorpha]KAG7910781.1 hypothetical protein KL906_001161 [Ogataea polymorpha]KAG7918673.1 hypothetical protein KL927_002130 [Ogataea polymorpha]KAG7923798.1 hypothetical protein KL905_001016 [Ogataea polymorpha]
MTLESHHKDQSPRCSIESGKQSHGATSCALLSREIASNGVCERTRGRGRINKLLRQDKRKKKLETPCSLPRSGNFSFALIDRDNSCAGGNPPILPVRLCRSASPEREKCCGAHDLSTLSVHDKLKSVA